MAHGLAACALSRAASHVTWTTAACPGCAHPQRIVGQPLRLDFSWPCEIEQGLSDEDRAREEQRCREPFAFDVSCGELPCEVKHDLAVGERTVWVKPQAEGTLLIEARMTDAMLGTTRIDAFGPIEVRSPDALAIACTYRRPEGGPRLPCGEAVPAGHDVHVEIATLRQGERLPGVAPEVVNIDGTKLRPGEAGADWRCSHSIDASDQRGTTFKCVRYGVEAGEQLLTATLGALEARLRLRVVSGE